jgi:hypothetical protein
VPIEGDRSIAPFGVRSSKLWLKIGIEVALEGGTVLERGFGAPIAVPGRPGARPLEADSARGPEGPWSSASSLVLLFAITVTNFSGARPPRPTRQCGEPGGEVQPGESPLQGPAARVKRPWNWRKSSLTTANEEKSLSVRTLR